MKCAAARFKAPFIKAETAWAEAVIEVHGNVLIEWMEDGCIVEGEKFTNKEAAEIAGGKESAK